MNRRITGEEGLAAIRGRVLDATYVAWGEYLTPVRGRPAKPGGRIAKTYEALADGPQTGHYLYAHGNHMPRSLGGFEFEMELQRSQHDSRLVQETVALSV